MDKNKINEDIKELHHKKTNFANKLEKELMPHVEVADVHIKFFTIKVTLRSEFNTVSMETLETIRDFMGIKIDHIECEEKKYDCGEDTKEYSVVLNAIGMSMEEDE